MVSSVALKLFEFYFISFIFNSYCNVTVCQEFNLLNLLIYLSYYAQNYPFLLKLCFPLKN